MERKFATAKPIIACDWFSFSLHSMPPAQKVPENWSVENLEGNKVFKCRSIYRYRDSKVITVLYRPKSKIIKADICLCEVANRWLYDACSLDEILSWMFPMYVFSNLSRVDICADFEINENITDMINKLARGDAYVGGKKLGNVWYEETNDRTPYDLNFGSTKSKIKWKLYNKSKEIRVRSENCLKPWIKYWWLSNGVHDVTKMWRLEVSYHGSSFSDLENFHLGLHDMQEQHALKLAFAEFYKYRFQVRERGHSRKANDKIIPFLDIDVPIEIVKRQVQRTQGRYADEKEVITALNRLINVYKEERLSDDIRTSVLSSIELMAEEYHLLEYTQKMLKN